MSLPIPPSSPSLSIPPFTEPPPPVRRGRPTLTVVLTTVALGALTLAEVRGAEPAPPAPPAPAGSPSTAPAAAQKATAPELVAAIRKALAAIAKNLGAAAAAAAPGPDKAGPPPSLPPRTRAFREALADAGSQTEALAAALGKKEKTSALFPAMCRVGVSLAALQVTVRYGGFGEDDARVEGFRKAAAAYGVLRRNYGRDLLAPTSESETTLSAAQKDAFDVLKSRGVELSKKLAAMQPALKDNPAAAFETETLVRSLAGLEQVRRDRRGALNALAVAELALGRWNGLKLYTATVFPGDAASLAPADHAVAAFETALGQAGETAFAQANAANVFDRSADYLEDLAVEGVGGDPEVAALLQNLRATPPAVPPPPTPAPTGAAATTDAVDRAADRETNAEDPDDDTSLDAEDDGEEAAADDED